LVWEDSPSHVCRGGDKRALTWCCPPVKPCPIIYALEDAGMRPQDYIDIKEEFGRKTRLGYGEGTCFGSLVWCCKTSKPCPLRDIVLRKLDMSTEEYIDLKKELSEELVVKDQPDIDESLKALSETFNVSTEEALQVLQDCDNDLKNAIRVLRMNNLEI
jgi:putative methanogenesis marker domain 9